MFGDLSPVQLAGILLVGSAGGVALLVSAIRVRGAILPICLMLMFSSLAVAEDYLGRPIPTVFTPIQLMRSELFLGSGIVVLFMVLLHQGTIWHRGFNWPGFVMLMMAVYASLLRFFHEGGSSGVLSLMFAFGTIFPLLVVVPAMIEDFHDIVRLFRWVMGFSIAWFVLVFVQVAIDPSKVVAGQQFRFQGLTGNPQHAAVLIAMLAALALWLLLNDPVKRYKPLWIGLVATNMVLVAWTGSRTGMGMMVLAISGVLYARAGRAILFLPLVTIVVFAVFSLLQALGIEIMYERLASTENTREGAWNNLLQGGLDSPLFGLGVEGAGDSENGYLFGFAAYGVGMVALILVLIGVCGLSALALVRRRSAMSPPYRSLVDLTIGFYAAYFGGSFFEGYMMARVAANLVFFMLISGIAARLIRLADDGIASEDPSQIGVWYDEESDEYVSYADAPEDELLDEATPEYA